MLTLDDFADLQSQADAAVGQDRGLSQDERNMLTNLTLACGATVSEGDLVEITGFLVGLPNRPKIEGAESVNCRLNGPQESDFHIPVARNAGDDETSAIIVEMIPQNRPSSWDIAAIRQIAQDQQQVLVLGQLMYDNKHKVNDDPGNVLTGQPKRFSIWEVHPVTEFYLCKQASCDPSNLSGWTLLGKVATQVSATGN
jgi:hypothetical protein